ncbi:ATPase [Pseudorhizobium halotolerans]|uniref:ATPase n=1 Tax=Pseudorhizobium halotolerans TaxID=1233081 RepID=A0ABN7K4R6_9HYPH|nr:SRPBCC domain-containing protein [Pseudorhizobium halotolerans]CAD7056018.1 ATPase [Pseudorhizobium halotolerans]
MDGQSQYHREFTLERLYPNCRAHAWSAWSIREKKAAWLRSATLEMDFSVGGVERSGFRTAMGQHTSEGRYFEIKEGERIVFAYSMAVNGRVHTVSLATILFEDEGGGTRLTYTEQMCVIPPSDGAEGREHGWGALLDGLAGFLAADTKQARLK